MKSDHRDELLPIDARHHRARVRLIAIAIAGLLCAAAAIAIALLYALCSSSSSETTRLPTLSSSLNLNSAFYTYPPPSRTFAPSPKYSIAIDFTDKSTQTVINTSTSFVYFSALANRPTAPSGLIPGQAVSWTAFALNSTTYSATITISTSFVFTSCIVRPSAYGIACAKTSSTYAKVIVLETMLKLSIEFYSSAVGNTASFITLPLFIFVDPPETLVPAPVSMTPLTFPPNVWYYGPGVYNFSSKGGQIPIPCSVSMVYLAPGAYVLGGFITQCSNTQTYIVGRGILSGEIYPHLSPLFVYGLVNVDIGYQNVVDGITILDPPQFHLRSFSQKPQINNVKMPSSWFYNSDGVDGGNGGRVQNCFIRANDDSIKLQGSGATVVNMVVWQMINGAVVQFGWDSQLNLVNNAASGINVIRVDYCNYYTGAGTTCANPSYGALINLAPSGTSEFGINGMTFSNIVVETDAMRTFFIEAPSGAHGSITRLSFVDITVPTQSLDRDTLANTIATFGSVAISDISFTRVNITGQCLTPTSSHLVLTGVSGVSWAC